MKKRAAIVAGALLLIGLQFFQPDEPIPTLPGDGPMEQYVAVPREVDRLLRAACYDCHSGETRWPWYARVSPVSWLIAEDIQHGRSNLDFSRWSTDPVREPTPVQRLSWICRDLRDGIMAPWSYRLMHSEARLTPEQQEVICAWTQRAVKEIESASGASGLQGDGRE